MGLGHVSLRTFIGQLDQILDAIVTSIFKKRPGPAGGGTLRKKPSAKSFPKIAPRAKVYRLAAHIHSTTSPCARSSSSRSAFRPSARRSLPAGRLPSGYQGLMEGILHSGRGGSPHGGVRRSSKVNLSHVWCKFNRVTIWN
jgi:hypothetical protein